jgi:hypothetical protein
LSGVLKKETNHWEVTEIKTTFKGNFTNEVWTPVSFLMLTTRLRIASCLAMRDFLAMTKFLAMTGGWQMS